MRITPNFYCKHLHSTAIQGWPLPTFLKCRRAARSQDHRRTTSSHRNCFIMWQQPWIKWDPDVINSQTWGCCSRQRLQSFVSIDFQSIACGLCCIFKCTGRYALDTDQVYFQVPSLCHWGPINPHRSDHTKNKTSGKFEDTTRCTGFRLKIKRVTKFWSSLATGLLATYFIICYIIKC